MSDNIIKKTCKELNITYKELADILGYEEASLRTIAGRENVTNQLVKAIELYRENLELKRDLSKLREFIKILEKYQ